MRKACTYIAGLILMTAGLLMSSCERRDLTYPDGNLAIVPIHIDWSESKLDETQIHRASVWLFPKDGGLPMEYPVQENIRDFVIKVPVGAYSIIVFNETAKDEKWDNFIEFRGTDRYETFGAYLLEDNSTLAQVRGGGQQYHMTAKALAAWSLDDFVVTQDMISITRTRANVQSRSGGSITKAEEADVDRMLSKVASVVPQPMVRSVFVHAQVKNLNSAKGATAAFHGVAHGVLLATGNPVANTVVHLLKMNNRQYDENQKDGTIENRFLAFGLRNDNVIVNLNFLMHDDTWLEEAHRFNVTKIVNGTQDYEVVIHIGVPMPGQPEEEDHDIILPESSLDPEVGVGEWDEELIDIK